jgi:hypothetical protein
MTSNDLLGLKYPLAALAAMVAIGAAAVYFTDDAHEGAKRELVQQQKLLQEARTKLQRSGDEKQLIVRFLDDYHNLERVGFVGEEQRINWLDGLRLTNQQTQLFGVDYQIGAQQAYPFASEFDPGQLVIRQSLMKVTFSLLHENDLMRFLETLAKQGVGVFAVNQCTLNRIAMGGGAIRYQPNLSAECELAWITVTPQTGARK